MTFFLAIVLITVLVQFFGAVILPLLPFLFLLSMFGLIFRRPSIRVYTRTFPVSPDGSGFEHESVQPGISEKPSPSASTVIDADYTENEY